MGLSLDFARDLALDAGVCRCGRHDQPVELFTCLGVSALTFLRRRATVGGQAKQMLGAFYAFLRLGGEVAASRFDAVTDLAQVLPLAVVPDFIGLPERGRDQMLGWAAATFNAIGPLNERAKEGFAALESMGAYACDSNHRFAASVGTLASIGFFEGVALREGDAVFALFAPANRDERKWTEPEVFDVTRRCSDHVAFGFGVHGCAGQGLARIEAQAILSALAQRVEEIDLIDCDRTINNITRSFRSLQIAVSPAR